MTDEQEKLYNVLWNVRHRLAVDFDIGDRAVLRNVSLEKLAIFRPKNRFELCSHCGISKEKARTFGNAFLNAIAEFENDAPETEQIGQTDGIRHTFVNFTPQQHDLNKKLSLLRSICAKQLNKPAYAVFSDVTIIDMIRKLPFNRAEFMTVEGITKAKCDQYADMFIAVIVKNMGSLYYTASWSSYEKEALALEYQEGKSLETIAETHRRTPSSVLVQLREMGAL